MIVDISQSATPMGLVTPVQTQVEQNLSASGDIVWIATTGTPCQKSVRELHAPTAEDEQAFNELARQWRAETRALSSDSDIAASFAYHRIIGMGPRVLPLIFRELQERGGRWYWALRAITGENPVRPEDRGNVRRMNETWLAWGRQNNYVR